MVSFICSYVYSWFLSMNFLVYLLCRRGNDSQRAVSYLKRQRFSESVTFYNIKGGLHEYSKRVDNTVPIY